MKLSIVKFILNLQIPAEFSVLCDMEDHLLVMINPKKPDAFQCEIYHNSGEYNNIVISYIDDYNNVWRHWFRLSSSVRQEYQNLVQILPESLKKYLPYIQRSILHTCGVDVLSMKY